jgi:hypothetical protein
MKSTLIHLDDKDCTRKRKLGKEYTHARIYKRGLETCEKEKQEREENEVPRKTH